MNLKICLNFILALKLKISINIYKIKEIRQKTLEHYLEIATMKDLYIFLVEYKMKLVKLMDEKEKFAYDLNLKMIE